MKGFEPILDETGKITGYKTSVGGADTVFPFSGGSLVLMCSHLCRYQSAMINRQQLFYNNNYIDASNIINNNVGFYYAKEDLEVNVWLSCDYISGESAKLQVNGVTVYSQSALSSNGYSTSTSRLVYKGTISIKKGDSIRILNGTANSNCVHLLLCLVNDAIIS